MRDKVLTDTKSKSWAWWRRTEEPPPERPTWNAIQDEIARHFADHPVQPPKDPANAARLDALVRDGVVFIDALISLDELSHLKQALTPRMDALRAVDHAAAPGLLHLFPELGRMRHYG